MTKKEEFILKDSPKELIEAAGVEPKGRSYDGAFETKPGAINIDDILLGTKLACIAITDDEDGTLANEETKSPWHLEALKIITGSDEEAHKPLSHILKNHFDLSLDKIINLTGWAGGHPIDTQGFIAHNDDTVVVSFRCTTSAMDWMTNFAAASSEWELKEDLAQGHSGWGSSFEGHFFGGKPRVHTGFYNNILQTIPILEEFVHPLLLDEKPKKLYVTGHSLGAGMSTLASCYFLQKYDWKDLPHKLINVSAGTPRSCHKDMAEVIEKQLAELRPLDKALICRVVMDQDVVAKIPLGYVDVGKLVFLTEDGHVLIGPKCDESHIIDEDEMKEMCKSNPGLRDIAESDEDEEGDENLTAYEKKMKLIPGPFRDHCPDCYLAPLVKLYNRERG